MQWHASRSYQSETKHAYNMHNCNTVTVHLFSYSLYRVNRCASMTTQLNNSTLLEKDNRTALSQLRLELCVIQVRSTELFMSMQSVLALMHVHAAKELTT